jgi:hypothetical protein
MGELVDMQNFKMARPAPAFQNLDAQGDDLSEGIGSSYGVLGYKGKVWTIRYRGEKHTFVRQDDGTPANYIDVIVLRQAHAKSKSYYKDFDPNSAGDRPICAALDGVTPDADVQERQSPTCATCPRNEWKMQPNGKQGRECTDYKRLAVLLLPTISAPLFGGVPLMEPVFLRVPPASLNNLAVVGETMGNQGWHYSSYIMRISFDPNEAHPKMIFKPLQGLTDKEAPVVLPLREDMQAKRITGEDQAARITHVAEVKKPDPLPVGGAATGLAPSTPASASSLSPAPLTSPASSEAGARQPSLSETKVSAPPATAATATVPAQTTDASATSSAVDTGFGLVTNPPAQTAQPAPSQTSEPTLTATPASTTIVADQGEATDSDADLDAKIAAMMK